jgi:hypothetical protein
MTDAQDNPTDNDTVAELDAQIAEQQAQIDELRQQVGGQGEGPMDTEDVAAALNNVEELQGGLEALKSRRERVAGQS